MATTICWPVGPKQSEQPQTSLLSTPGTTAAPRRIPRPGALGPRTPARWAPRTAVPDGSRLGRCRSTVHCCCSSCCSSYRCCCSSYRCCCSSRCSSDRRCRVRIHRRVRFPAPRAADRHLRFPLRVPSHQRSGCPRWRRRRRASRIDSSVLPPIRSPDPTALSCAATAYTSLLTRAARVLCPVRSQRGGSPRHAKLFTYLAMSIASCRLAPEGCPVPKLGLNSWYGPAAAAISATSFYTDAAEVLLTD